MFWKQLVKLQQVSVFCLKTICLSLALWAAMKPQRVKQSIFIATWRNDPVQAQGFEENGQSWISECLWAQNHTSKPTVSQARNCCAMFLLETNCSHLNNKSCSFAPGTSPTSKARMCSNEGASMPGVKQEQVSPHVEGSCTNKLIRCLTKHWRRTSSNSRFPTAAENQLLTSCHGVYWDQKCKLGKHNAENNVCKPFYAVSSAMRLINDTRERCNQKTTYIKSCVWDHAHDVMRREAKQCFTVDILLHDSIWLQTIL